MKVSKYPNNTRNTFTVPYPNQHTFSSFAPGTHETSGSGIA